MANPAHLVPHALDRIDLERWDRPSVIVGLVAARSWEARTWAQIGKRDFAELGRNASGVRWDLRVLDQLVEDRVLRKLSVPRHFAVFQVRDPGDWRKIPWLSHRRAALAALRASGADSGEAWWGVGAGQSVFRSGSNPPENGGSDTTSTLNHYPHHATPTPHHATARSSDQEEGRGHYPTTPRDHARLHNAFDGTYVPSSSRGDDDDGGVPAGQAGNLPEDQLVAAVAASLRCQVWGSPAQSIREIWRAHPERRADLLTAAGKLGEQGVRSPVGAAEALRSLAAGVTSSATDAPADPRARLEVIRRLIMTLEQVDPGSDRLGELAAERESLLAITGEG